MHTYQSAEERAKESLVFALLRRQTVEAEFRVGPPPKREEPRLPLRPKKPMNVDKALAEIVARFSKTLDYLAK